MLRRAAIVLTWAGLGLWGVPGCGGFLDPLAFRGTGGATDAGPTEGSGGNGGSGGSGAIGGGNASGGTGCPSECVLQPSDRGWVEAQDSVCCTIQGAWYPYDDCNDSPGNCTQNHQPASDAGTFAPFEGKKNSMCTSGITAAVGEAGSSRVWGAGIGLWLNQVKDSVPEIHKPIKDLPRAPIGFRFLLTGTIGSNGLRVNFPYTDSDPVPHFVSLPKEAGLYPVYIVWAQPAPWATVAETIVPEQVVSIQFATPAGPDPIAFDFCVNELTALFER